MAISSAFLSRRKESVTASSSGIMRTIVEPVLPRRSPAGCRERLELSESAVIAWESGRSLARRIRFVRQALGARLRPAAPSSGEDEQRYPCQRYHQRQRAAEIRRMRQ